MKPLTLTERRRILVIDDDASMRDFIRSVLDRAGYDVSVCGNGREGAAAFRKDDFALVITDMVMPVADGIEAISLIRKANPLVPIVAMSGVDRSKSLLKMADYFTADATLQKPFGSRQLLSIIKKFLCAG
jgi:DNA-binding response OmpR family regulator